MEKNDCSCDKCTSACYRKPGWFRPGQVEILAEKAGMPLKDYFNKFLAVDYYLAGTPEESTFVLSPATAEVLAEEFPFNPRGICAFLKDNKCSIHEDGKPNECSFYTHDVSIEDSSANRDDIVESWKPHQQQIEKLLGRKPEVAMPDISDLMNMLTNGLSGKDAFASNEASARKETL